MREIQAVVVFALAIFLESLPEPLYYVALGEGQVEDSVAAAVSLNDVSGKLNRGIFSW